ncbi:MAG: hypothetical protein RUDDFDWM_001768, partial [Candidatus Fervidibacterota bacterium]
NPFTMTIFGANFNGGATYWVFLRDPLNPTYQVRSLTSAVVISDSQLQADFDLWRNGNPVRPGLYDVIVATDMTGTVVVGRLGRAFEVTSPMLIVDYWNNTDFPNGIPNHLGIGYKDRQAFTGAPPGRSPDINTVTIRILGNATFTPGTTVRLQSARGTPDNPRGNAQVIIAPTNVTVSSDGRIIDARFQLDDDNAYAGRYWLTVEKPGSGGWSVVANVPFELYYHTPRVTDFYTPPPSPVNPSPPRQRQALFREIYLGLGVAVEGDDFHNVWVDGNTNRVEIEQPNVGLWLRVWRELAPGWTSSEDDGVDDGFYSHTSWYYTRVGPATSGLPGVVSENECRFVLRHDDMNFTSSPGNHYAYAAHRWAKQFLLIDGDGGDPRDDPGAPLMSSNAIFSVFLDYPNPVGVSPNTMINTGVNVWQLTVYGKVGYPSYRYDPHMFAPGAEVQLSKVGVPDDPTNIRTVAKPVVRGRTITCIFPPLSDPYKTGKRAEPGYWSVIVRNTDNKWTVLPNALRIVSPPPTITSVVYYTNTKDNNPAQSVWNGPPSLDGETGDIYIYGDNFMPGLTVKFKRNGSYKVGKDPQSQDDIVVVKWDDMAPDGLPRIRNKGELLTNRTRLVVVANFWGKAPGAWDVEVVNDDGQWGSKQRAINVLAKPTITLINPPQVNNRTNAYVTIEGTNFWPGINVRFKREGFADITASNIILDPNSKESPSPPNKPGGYTRLTCLVPTYGKPPGIWDAVLTNIGGPSSDVVVKGAGGPEDLEITADAPVVTLVSPNRDANSTTSVTVLIKGSNFFPGARVKLVRHCYTSGQLEERYGTGVNVTSETSIVATFNLQGLEPGSWRVVVENADGKSNIDTDGDGTIDKDYKGAGDEDGDGVEDEDGENPGSLFYITALAQIVRIEPSSNSNEPASNPFTLTIYGSNFWGNEANGLRVVLRRTGYSDIEATNESAFQDPPKITCELDITGAQLGKWSVVVANPESPEVVLRDAFTVTGPAPIVTAVTPSEAENNAIRRLVISGDNFVKGATVKLTRAGFLDIVGTNVVVTSQSEMAADFDLAGKAPGWWDVVVTNPDGNSGSGTNLFRLKAPNPIVTAVIPSEASNVSDVVNVIIQGDNFFPGCSVYVRKNSYSMPVTNVRVVRKDQISATFAVKDMPAGKWDVYVAAADDDGDPTNGIGDSGASGKGKFTVTAMAVVTGINPTSRLNDSANNPFTLTIYGLNFWGDENSGLDVRLRRGNTDILATGESSSPDHTQVTCSLNVEGAEPGYWNLVVRNPESPEVVISNAFVVQAKASISKVDPSSALNCDVVSVTITGENIWAGCDVRLQKAGEADIVARNVVVKSNTELTCDFDLRMKATGDWNLIVTNIQSPPSDPITFTITSTGNPTVDSITPDTAPNDVVVDVMVSGNNFMPTDTVRLVPVDISGSDSDLFATNVMVIDSQTISCRFNLVGRCPGSWKVVVSGLRNGSKVESAEDVRFTITAKPIVKSISPDSALNDGTVQVTISGNNFMKGANVRLKSGDTTIDGNVASVSRETIVCEFDLKGRRPMVMDVEVENTPTQIARLANAFKIQAKATITNVDPDKGENTNASLRINVVGNNIWRGATCKLKRNGYSDITPIAPPEVEERFVGGENIGSELTCQFDLRGRAPGEWNLVVINPLSPESEPFSWEIVGVYSPDYPEVTGIEPNVGANTGDLLVTIYGRFLYEGARVLLTKGASTIEGQNVRWTQEATKLICTLPLKDKEPGRYDLTVINTDGKSVTVQNAFTVIAPATITSISPTSASNTNPAFALTVNGSNFFDGAKVKLRRAGFADIEAISVNVVSRTQINCVFNLQDTDNDAGNGVQSASPGKWSVVVQNVPHDVMPMSPEAIYPDALTIVAPSPTVTRINPSEGERDSVVNVTITGNNFFAGASVALRKLGQAPIVSGNVQVINNTTIECSFDLTGTALGRWNVVVTNSDGQSGMLADGFLVKGKQPEITKVTPNQALKGTIVGVTIDGENFYPGIMVELRGNITIPGISTTLLSDKQVWTKFDLRNAVAGDYNVVVTNADGQSATHSFVVFEVPNINPEVDSVSPNFGDNDKLVTVTVTGRYFFPNATVKLVKPGQLDIVGTVIEMSDKDGDATNGNEEIQCRFDLRGKAPGKWDLIVVNINGLGSANTQNDDFTIKALAMVTGVVPSSALNTAPVRVTITGSNFWAGATAKLCHGVGGEVIGSNVVVADRTRIVCTFDIRGKLPAPWDVVVQNEGSAEGVKQKAFVVTAMSPVVTSVRPSERANNTVASLTIDGNYFYSPTVKLVRSGQQDVVATDVNVIDKDNNSHGDRITCKVDLRGVAIGRWDVVVTNFDGKSTRLSGALLVKSAYPPTVTSITPNSTTNYGSINVTIRGNYFYTGAVVRIEKDNGTSKKVVNATNVVVKSATQITATVNVHGIETGNWDVVVVNPDGQSGTLKGGLNVIQQGPPQITVVSPNSAPNTGQVAVEITGSMFLNGAMVRLTKSGQVDIPALSVKYTFISFDEQKLTCVFDLRDKAPGNWNVVVRNPDGKEGRLDNAFTITADAPIITAISPSYIAPNTGIVTLTITGTNFFSGAQAFLRLNTTNIMGTVTSISKTTLTCRFDLRGAQPGKWSVVVRNMDGKEGAKEGIFTITAPATISSISPTGGENTNQVSVTIYGSNFWSGATVVLRRKGQPDISATNVQVSQDHRQITCKFDLRGAAPGGRIVVVTNPFSSPAWSSNVTFMVYAPAPTITSVSPSEGLNNTSLTVKLIGENFYPGMLIRLRKPGQPDINGTNVVVRSNNEATCTLGLVGKAPGKWSLQAVNADGRTGVSVFVIKAQAVISAVTPSRGSNLQSKNPITVTISGSNFWSGAKVLLRKAGQPDIVASNVVVESRSRIKATFNLTGAATGKWDVVVINVSDGIESPPGVRTAIFNIVSQ